MGVLELGFRISNRIITTQGLYKTENGFLHPDVCELGIADVDNKHVLDLL